jgi:flagellar hook protein FlgE
MALYLVGGSNSGSTISLDLGTTYGLVTIPNGTTTGGVVLLLQANTTFNANFTATQTSNSIFIQANGIGDAYNIKLDSNADSRLSTVARDNLAGGVDDGATTRALATFNPDGNNKLQIAHRDLGASATLTIGNITMGSAMGLNLYTYEHTAYAADAQTTTGVETAGEQDLIYDFPNATSGQTITFDFSPTKSSASTQSAGANETFYLAQNGSPRGTLQGLSIDRTGLITGKFSNNILRTLGAVVLADFANPVALTRRGENLWAQSSDSGEPVINRPGQGGLGKTESGALEQSNVDLANEFVKMINYQRAFQANSKTISTTDQMLAELINLKR